jgi:hypothetical protein
MILSATSLRDGRGCLRTEHGGLTREGVDESELMCTYRLCYPVTIQNRRVYPGQRSFELFSLESEKVEAEEVKKLDPLKELPTKEKAG